MYPTVVNAVGYDFQDEPTWRLIRTDLVLAASFGPRNVVVQSLLNATQASEPSFLSVWLNSPGMMRAKYHPCEREETAQTRSEEARWGGRVLRSIPD